MMQVSMGLAAFVAVLHFYFMYLETVMWDTPKGHRIFGQTPDQAKASKVLAFNQGFYNGFLAIGLVWSLVTSNLSAGLELRLFCFLCVFIAGVLGGLTVHMRIFWLQGFPALLGFIVSTIQFTQA